MACGLAQTDSESDRNFVVMIIVMLTEIKVALSQNAVGRQSTVYEM